jgi:hypothetical protein
LSDLSQRYPLPAYYSSTVSQGLLIHVLFEESLSRYNSNNKTSSELTLCSKIVNIQQE